MQEEILALYENKSYSLVPLSKGKILVVCKRVLSIKQNSNGSVYRLKAKLMAERNARTYRVIISGLFLLLKN